MKKILIYISIVWLTLGFTKVFAQPLSLSNQYQFNDHYLNPAGAYHDGINGLLGFRQQWTGIQDAPSVKYITLNGKVHDNMAIGTVVNMEQYHIIENFNARLSYAYHIELTEDHLLDLGLEGIYRESRINSANIDVNDFSDNVILSNSAFYRGFGVDVNFGARYMYQDLKIGLSAYNLMANKAKLSDAGNSYSLASSRHFIGQLSYNYLLEESNDISIQPLALVRYYENSPISFDAGFLCSFKKIIKAGAVYRNNNSVVGTIALQFKESFMIGYSYDYAFGNDLANYANHTHEAYLGFTLGEGNLKSRDNDKKDFEKEEKLNTHIDSISNALDDERLKNQQIQKDYEDKLAELERKKKEKAKEKEMEEKMNSTSGTEEAETTVDTEEGKVNKESVDPVQEMKSLEKLEKGHYIVVKSFLDKAKADAQLAEMKSKGYKPMIVYNQKRGYYYIYLERFTNLSTALKELENVKASGFPDAWLYLHQ